LGWIRPDSGVKRKCDSTATWEGDLLIRVYAAAVMPTELSWYPTTHRRAGEKRAGAVLGHEFSGAVTAVGEDVSTLELGRDVFGMNDWFSDGAMADFGVAPFYTVAPKPLRLSHVEAASVPISALTGWQGLLTTPGSALESACSFMAGGRRRGSLRNPVRVHVIATISAPNAEFVAKLGAELVIDYRVGASLEDCVNGLDVVFDAVGGETQNRSWGILKPAGRMVTIVSVGRGLRRFLGEAGILHRRAKSEATRPDRRPAGRRAHSHTCGCGPLARAPEAYDGRLPRHHRGKIVVSLLTIQ
jgi:NADPH:quinone reductase-like Zn-dependent oxidoreductase